jgi:type 1 glutamine amidotransferase
MALRRVLLVSAGWFHPPYRGRVWLREALSELAGYAVGDEVSTLADAVRRPLTAYDVLVLYYHHRDVVLAADEIEAFRTFVQDGGGVVALHSATASYKPTPAYFEILGGRFIGHGPVRRLTIRPARDGDPTFGGIPAFTVTDELYLHELQPDIQVHFHADHHGRPTPVVWTKTVGTGRVCYVCPGHRSASMKNPAVRAIVQRGMRWVSGELP